jgi:hypothetical protein
MILKGVGCLFMIELHRRCVDMAFDDIQLRLSMWNV